MVEDEVRAMVAESDAILVGNDAGVDRWVLDG